MGEQRLLPDEPDGKEFGHRPVATAREFRLPQQPACVLRPAAEVDVEPVEGRLGRTLAQAQRLGGAQDRPFRRVRRLADMGAEAREPRDLGCQVVHRPGPPGGEGVGSGLRRPERLPPVEMPRGPEAEGLLDDRRPVGAGCTRGKIGHGRKRRRGGVARTGEGEGPQRGEVGRLQRRGGGRKRRGEVSFRDPALPDGRGIVCPALRDGDARHAGEPRRGGREILAGLAEEGVHRDRRVEREGRGDRPRRGLGGLEDIRDPCRCDAGMLEEHLGLHAVSWTRRCGTRRSRGRAAR